MGLVVDLLDTVAELLGADTTPADPVPPPEDPSTSSAPPSPTSTATSSSETRTAVPSSTTSNPPVPTQTTQPQPSQSSTPSVPADPSPPEGTSSTSDNAPPSTSTRLEPHPIALPHDPNPQGDDPDGPAPAGPTSSGSGNGATVTVPAASSTLLDNGFPSSSDATSAPSTTASVGRPQTHVRLSRGAIAAISVVSALVLALAIVCCVRVFFIRRRRAQRAAWATRPALFTRRRAESGLDFVTPRTSSERPSSIASDEYAANALFTGPPPSWSRASRTQQRRMLQHPNASASNESYGAPVPVEQRSVSPVKPPEMAFRPGAPSSWAYHPNAYIASASSLAPSPSFMDSPTSSTHALPDHSNVDLDAVLRTRVSSPALRYGAISPPVRERATSPTLREGAVSPFVTIIRHPDGGEEFGADLDAPDSPRAALHVRAITPVSPLYASAFGDPFASPRDGAVLQ